MAYIGKTPTPAPLTATDIPDLPATKITSGTFPALNGSNLTSLTAGNLTGSLPAISGASLTGVSAGKVLQVQSLTTQATDSITSKASGDSFTNTSVQIAITPSATSSKVLVLAFMNVGGSNASDGLPILALARGSTQICIGPNDQGSRVGASTGRLTDMIGSGSILPIHLSHLDSPNTTSATTYYVQMGIRGNGSGTARVNRSGDDSDNIENFRTASSITVMEIEG